MAAKSDYAKQRREARERAIELAYEAEIRGLAADELLATLPLAPLPFTETLLGIGEANRDEATARISARSRGWSIDRMATMDVVIMRSAIAELIEETAPAGAILAEAVELATRYSTDESGPFVNGVLAAIANDIAAERSEADEDGAEI